jgi:hypothetical protein
LLQAYQEWLQKAVPPLLADLQEMLPALSPQDSPEGDIPAQKECPIPVLLQAYQAWLQKVVPPLLADLQEALHPLVALPPQAGLSPLLWQIQRSEVMRDWLFPQASIPA